MAHALDRERGREERREQHAGALIDAATAVERAVHAFVQQGEDRVVGEREHEGGAGDERPVRRVAGEPEAGDRDRDGADGDRDVEPRRDRERRPSRVTVADEISHHRLRMPCSMLSLGAAVPAHERLDHATGGQHLVRRKLGAGGEAGAHRQHGAAADARRSRCRRGRCHPGAIQRHVPDQAGAAPRSPPRARRSTSGRSNASEPGDQ